MANRLDVVAVAIDDEGAIVVRMILRPKPGRSVVASAGRTRSIVERFHGSAIRSPDSNVAGRRGFARGNPEIRLAIGAEASCLAEVHHDFVPERRQCGLKKSFALGDVRNRYSNV